MKAALVSGPQSFSEINGDAVELDFAGGFARHSKILNRTSEAWCLSRSYGVASTHATRVSLWRLTADKSL
jgi:hypothetical protein